MEKKLNKNEMILGGILLIVLLILGRIFLQSAVFFRMIIGLIFGYALVRSCTGFAGSVNRAYTKGSTKLMRTLMFMFFCTAAISAGLLYVSGDATTYDLWVNPINLGLVLGGILFGFGMAFSMCCATGVLTDLMEGPTRALITIIFFGIGVFIAFPLQATQSWITNSLFSTKTFGNGVYLPDWFGWDGMNGYLGAVILTGIFCAIVVFLAQRYENKRRASGKFEMVPSEENQNCVMKTTLEEADETNKEVKISLYTIFVKPWSLQFGAIVITGAFTVLMAVTKAGWGASTPYGFWFGRLLRLFGVSSDSIASFTKMDATPFTMPFFENGMNVQNLSIILGALIALLLAGRFVKTFTSGLKVTGKESLIYIIGGLTMGIGTRFANGCNVGALYTPIANLSLSGWIFLIFLVAGGILGNYVKKHYLKA